MFNVSKSIGWVAYIVTSKKHQQKILECRVCFQFRALTSSSSARTTRQAYADFLLERITLEFFKLLVAPKARGTLKHLHACLMPFLINLVFLSFYWRCRRHPMTDLDRLVSISIVVKLKDSRRTTLPRKAFCARPTITRGIQTHSKSKRSVNVSTEAKHSIFICYVARSRSRSQPCCRNPA